MSNKLITDAGKTELLRLGFKSEEAGGAFSYLALGGANSTGAQGQKFTEVSGGQYSRVQTEITENKDKSITITGTFKEDNYAPTDGSGQITEIGLCNQPYFVTDGEIFFMYSEVPPIIKTGDISLQYTIIISID